MRGTVALWRAASLLGRSLMLPEKYYEFVCCRNYRKAVNVMLVSFEKRSTGVEKQKINPSMWGFRGGIDATGGAYPRHCLATAV